MKLVRLSNLLPFFLVFVVFVENSQAIPAFSRQTGLECMMCHAQNQTKLNGFGRGFARSAYTMSSQNGSQSLIVGDEIGLGMPMVLNMSLMLKAKYDKGYGDINGKGVIPKTPNGDLIDTNRGVYEIFKTSTLNIGGKVADNVGALIEFREKEGKSILGGKVVSSFELAKAYAGFSIFSTDTYGPFSGAETYNTGLYKPLRQFENHKLTNAAQATDLASGEATGGQLFYSGENLFATLGAYVPKHNNDGIDIGGSMIPFSRIAYEQPIGDTNLIMGGYGIKGVAKMRNTTFEPKLIGYVPQALVEVKKEAYGVDLQVEGYLFSQSSLLTANAVLKNTTTLDKPYLMNYLTGSILTSIFGEPEDADMKAYSIEWEVYPISSLGLKLSVLKLDDMGSHTYEPDKVDVKDKNTYTVGFDYSYRQNIMLSMEYSMIQPMKKDIEDYTALLTVLTISL